MRHAHERGHTMREYEDIENKIDALLTVKADQLAAYDEKIQQATAAADRAELEAQAAFSKPDIPAYQAAERRAQTARDTIQAYTDKADAVKHQPIISDDEYSQMREIIQAEQRAKHAQAVLDIKALIDKISAIAEKEVKEKTKGNDLLRVLKQQLYSGSKNAWDTGEDQSIALKRFAAELQSHAFKL